MAAHLMAVADAMDTKASRDADVADAAIAELDRALAKRNGVTWDEPDAQL